MLWLFEGVGAVSSISKPLVEGDLEWEKYSVLCGEAPKKFRDLSDNL